jgi:hypothetical protein
MLAYVLPFLNMKQTFEHRARRNALHLLAALAKSAPHDIRASIFE